MSLQDTFQEREFGPSRDDRWEEASDFTIPTMTPKQDSFDVTRPLVIAEARTRIEKIFLDVRDQADSDLL